MEILAELGKESRVSLDFSSARERYARDQVKKWIQREGRIHNRWLRRCGEYARDQLLVSTQIQLASVGRVPIHDGALHDASH